MRAHTRERFATLIADLRAKHELAEQAKLKVKYNQGTWFEGVENLPEDAIELKTPKQFSNYVPAIIKEGACGTAACVLGHAALIPEFQKKGLTFGVYDWNIDSYDKVVGSNMLILYNKRGAPDMKEGMQAGAEFFGIPIEHARVLFGAHDHVDTIMFYTGLGYDEADEIGAHDEIGEPDGPFYQRVNLAVVADKLEEYVATAGQNVEDVIEEVHARY